jgi:hypothetical protein
VKGRDFQYAFFDEASRWHCACGVRCDPRNHPKWRKVSGKWQHWHDYPTGWVPAKRRGSFTWKWWKWYEEGV